MSMDTKSLRWIRVAVIYFGAAVCVGIYMAASADHTLRAVHSHMNLAGWVSMAVIGMLHQLYPPLGAGRWASSSFWFYQIGLPVMLVALALHHHGYQGMEPFLGAGSVLVFLAVLIFAGRMLGQRVRG